ncbi:hypothetical protein COW36_01890 [bacterium (Candidatus Blackallbacteria) CG17_big_fil_post_rev_8_21_14_2_50_48_46]|uniref:DUF192 domain-containing protein n=1 Tax=bacterium (Candidatus Blackallbacteria) CG17_big_fil_post_rev_8_21_14_2_50_48_46 TaxID=2014261 RepID=A0A2M7GAL4_9BACT|nr:MAG: hypothetical protein COW64_26280 [bacterium (Candidatus Blackallbacteria) CG18_big_fil_WC_8_21_14_2_50_49_26]PIW19187.1 MAG: hypothetical protein COW36_01890 [bacterium (Candidatus Blackallbacteria) CG17_big_fil_post_rev_8_21_14_2_50_48_46]PIW45463.1 MAG: hypothetical protein COW20_20250 [bacterium (Candidatus Blackallbacteria) CG13_big_fil_rev_8_21_14_2_50_49_14]
MRVISTRRFAQFLIPFLAFGAVACSPVDARAPQTASKATASPLALIPAKFGEIELQLELARTPQEQQTGLMNRKSLPENQGMLFIFEQEKTLGFWMKNTLIPLSIAFLNSKLEIVDIQEMQALDETTHISLKPALYALEMNQAWFKKHSIQVGTKLTVSLPEAASQP